MSVFNEEDGQIVRSLAMTSAGFVSLTVGLVLIALFISA